MLNLSIEPWRAVNDGVMGGVSSGMMIETEHGLAFKGSLSLENNGGFASVRRLMTEDLSDTRGVRITVRGDGRNYQFRARQGSGFDGPAWSKGFQTNGDLQTINIEFEDLDPVFRGRRLNNLGSIDPAKIRQIGFLLADKSPGRFSLEILGVELLR